MQTSSASARWDACRSQITGPTPRPPPRNQVVRFARRTPSRSIASNPHRTNRSAPTQPRDFVPERFSDASQCRTPLNPRAWRPRNLHPRETCILADLGCGAASLRSRTPCGGVDGPLPPSITTSRRYGAFRRTCHSLHLQRTISNTQSIWLASDGGMGLGPTFSTFKCSHDRLLGTVIPASDRSR